MYKTGRRLGRETNHPTRPAGTLVRKTHHPIIPAGNDQGNTSSNHTPQDMTRKTHHPVISLSGYNQETHSRATHPPPNRPQTETHTPATESVARRPHTKVINQDNMTHYLFISNSLSFFLITYNLPFYPNTFL